MLSRDIRMGVGTWAWGDRLLWDYGHDYRKSDLKAVFYRSLSDGVNFFAVSPSFAEGESERLLGEFSESVPQEVLISTKFVPRIWHMQRSDFLESLRQSLSRLRLSRIEIYEICPPAGRMTLSRLAECAAEALDLGLIAQVGLSNYNAQQIDTFNEALSRFGYSIACLETPYNLLCRDIESNGVLEICRRLGITIIAQQPLAMGLLTGKYDFAAPASGNRRQMMLRYSTPRPDILMRTMNHIGLENNGKNTAQVALNWIMNKGIIPIPGAKTLSQAIENAQTPSWSMTEEQAALLDTLTNESREPSD